MRLTKVIITTLALLAIGCQQTSKPKSETETETESYEVGTRRMERTVAPLAEIRNVEELNYAIAHFWDGFDFECGERVAEYNTDDICQAFIDYTMLVYTSGDLSHLQSLMERASASREVLDLFMSVSEMVLHDPNSPLRNDELYIPILEYLVESPLLDEYDRMIPEHDLHIAMQNRLGHKANDIVYTTAKGKRGTLYDIEADYTLLMFNNPDCPTCRMIIDNIVASPLMNEMQEMGRLKVIAIYPDADLEAWHRYVDKMPRRWIVSYDEGQRITHDKSYDLRAIPSLYLLDKDKRVMVKDSYDVAYIENVIARAESDI